MADTYIVAFHDKDGQRITLDGLRVTVDSYSHAAIGGPKKAQITIRGPRERLWRVIDLLATDVQIFNGSRDWRWGGYVETASVSIGAMTLGLTIKNIANMIQVTYVEHTIDANGQEQQAQAFTLWAGDSESIERYGAFQSRLTFGDSTEAAAERYRDAVLSTSSLPIDSMEFGFQPGDVAAVLDCVGYWQTLDRRYYQATALTSGTTEATGATSMPLYSGSYPAAIRLAQRLSIPANTALAAATFVVQKVGSPTGSLRCEMWRAPVGNDPTTLISYVDVSLDELPDDEVAPTITLDSVTVSSNTATATKTAHGFSVEQDTTIAGADMPYVNGAKIVRTVPDADHFTFDAAGDDGTAIGTITATTAPEPPPAAPVGITFNFPNAKWPAGYDAFIALSIDAMNVDASNYVNVSCSPRAGLGQGLRQYGLGWTNLDSAIGSLRYQLTLTRETTALIAERVDSHIDALAGTVIEQASGIFASPYEDGQSRVGETIINLLNMGCTTSARLLARVSREKILIVSPEPLKTDDVMFLYDPTRGELTNANGVPLAKDTCPCGSWAEITGVPKGYFQRGGRSVVVTVEHDAIVTRDEYGAIINPITSLAIGYLAGPLPAGTLLRFHASTSDVITAEAVTTTDASIGATTLSIQTLQTSIIKGSAATYGVPSGTTTGPRIFIEEAEYTPSTGRLEIRARNVKSVWDVFGDR